MYIIYENCCNTAMTSVTDPVLKVNGASQVIWVRIMLVGPIIREVLLQIALKEANKSKNSFITPFGTYCYMSMSFGLKNMGAIYQCAIHEC